MTQQTTTPHAAGTQGYGGMSSAVEAALHCHATCVQTIQHCLQHGGEHVAKDHMTLMQDCAQICITSADFMLRESKMHGQVCGVCADICEACAKSCDSVNDPDGAMKRCADACRRCSEECRQMAQVHA